jgi:hypothetical protein
VLSIARFALLRFTGEPIIIDTSAANGHANS